MKGFNCTKAEKTAIQTVLNSKDLSISNPAAKSLRDWTEYSIGNLINFQLLKNAKRSESITIPFVRDVCVRDGRRFGLASEELCRSVDVDWIDSSVREQLQESLNVLHNWDDELEDSGIHISDFSRFLGSVVTGADIHQLVELGVIAVDEKVNDFEERAKFKRGISIELLITLLNIDCDDVISLQSYVVTLRATAKGNPSVGTNAYDLVDLAYKLVDEGIPKIIILENELPTKEKKGKSIDSIIASAKAIGKVYSEISASLSSICSQLRSSKNYAEILTIRRLARKVGVKLDGPDL